jgi:hypothetical protein
MNYQYPEWELGNRPSTQTPLNLFRIVSCGIQKLHR